MERCSSAAQLIFKKRGLGISDLGSAFSEVVVSGPLLLGLLAAAVAGLVSFASPCVIPLVPGYISYLAGVVGATTEHTSDGALVKQYRGRVGGAALLFVAGFTVVFSLATVTVFGVVQTVQVNQGILMRVGGVVTILMGLVFMGFIRPLQNDTRMAPPALVHSCWSPPAWGSFCIGMDPLPWSHTHGNNLYICGN